MRSLDKRSFVLVLMVLMVGSCTTQNTTPRADIDNSPTLSAYRQDLLRLTDIILKTLATKEYTALEKSVPQTDPPLSGRYIAEQLLGPHPDSVVLEKWDARRINITFDADCRNADVSIPLRYRSRPNRKPVTTTMVLPFSRNESDLWHLVIPVP